MWIHILRPFGQLVVNENVHFCENRSGSRDDEDDDIKEKKEPRDQKGRRMKKSSA